MSASSDRNTAATNYDAGFWDDAEMVERPDGSPILEPLDRAPTYHTIADATSLSTNGRTEEEDSTVPPPPYEGPSEVADEEKVDKKEQAEEVAPDVLVDVLFEEVINNYDLGGPFVRRLKAYRTSSGEIVVREEKIKIEDGTKLEMGPFADCAFTSYGTRVFRVWGTIRTNSLEVTKKMVTMKTGNCTTNNVGPNKATNVGSKAMGMNFGSNGMTSIFNVEGWSFEVSEDGSIISKPPSTMSSGGATPNVISRMDEDQVTQDAPKTMEDGLRAGKEEAAEEGRKAARAARNATRNISTVTVSTIHSGSGNQFNHSGPGVQFIHRGTGRQNFYSGNGIQINTDSGTTTFEF